MSYETPLKFQHAFHETEGTARHLLVGARMLPSLPASVAWIKNRVLILSFISPSRAAFEPIRRNGAKWSTAGQTISA